MRLAALLAVTVLLLAGCAKKDSDPSPSTQGCDGIDRAGLTLANQSSPVVAMTTNQGCIVVELYAHKAPITAENFLAYTDSGFFDNTLIHRISKGFVLQGGGTDATTGTPKSGLRAPIKNEACSSGLRNEAYTLSMARTTAPDSATSQFFVNLKHNTNLDPVNCEAGPNGYAVFGKVVKGTEVVDAIHALPVTSPDRHGYCLPREQSCPVDPVPILSVRRV